MRLLQQTSTRYKHQLDDFARVGGVRLGGWGNDREHLGSAQNMLAEKSFERVEAPNELIESLTLADRKAIFGSDWQTRAAASLRIKSNQPAPPASSRMRLQEYARQHADSRRIKQVADYVSQVRTLERLAGRSLRLDDLTSEFYKRFVQPLSRSSRKRIDAIWNAAARSGLVDPPPKDSPVRAPHPMYWRQDQLKQFFVLSKELRGTIPKGNVARADFWQGLIGYLAASGTMIANALQLTWDSFYADKVTHCRLASESVSAITCLEKSGDSRVFPWSSGKFQWHYDRLVRRADIFEGRLTSRERDVLLWTAQGDTEQQIANRVKCGLHTVRQYRRRIRDKLGFRGNVSLRDVVLHAKNKGLLPAELETRAANPVIYIPSKNVPRRRTQEIN